MSRREALGVILVGAFILLGRLARRLILCSPTGAWREPGWLEANLPPLEEASPEPSRPVKLGPPSTPLDPNSCPADSLVRLPGVGPTIAGRIVAARAQGVHFACARDMPIIRGIGPGTIARIEPYLVFGQRHME